MTSQIPVRQNEQRSLDRLAAYSRLYTVAKRVQFTRVALVVLLAAASPCLFLWNDQLTAALGIAGALTVIAEAVCRAYEGHLVTRAVGVQDCFDAYIFDLPWNEYLVGNEPDHELVSDAARKFSGDRGDHENWYTVTQDVPRPYDVLMAQRQNLVWDSRLRRAFATLTAIAWGVWLTVEIGIGLIIDIDLREFLLVFIVPGLPAFIAGIDLTVSNWRTSSIRNQLGQMWGRLWKRALANPGINESELRQLQDAIYVCRTRTVQVPNWMQKRKRAEYQADSVANLDHLRKELAAAGRLEAAGGGNT